MPRFALAPRLRFLAFTLLSTLLLTWSVWVAAPPALVSAQAPENGITAQIDTILDSEPNFADDFFSDLEFWSTPYDGETSRFFKSGRFYIAVDVPDTVAFSRGDTTVEDFYAEVDTIHIAGNVSNQLGLIFRLQDENNFYFFAIGNDGYYSLLKLENNQWTNLVDWTESDAINSGSAARNRVAVLAEGSEFTLLVNDEIIAEIEDHTFASGQIALTAGSYEQPGIEIAFDNFALWRLGEPITQPSAAPPPLSQLAEEDTSGLLEFIENLTRESPDYLELFLFDDGGWDVFETENVLTQHMLEGLVMLVRAPQRLGTSVYPRTVSDFYMEVDVAHLDGPIDAEVGIVFRETDADNYYFYAITNDGYYSLWRKRHGEWQVLLDWATADALETGPGAANTLGVLAQSERIVLLANDAVLAETTDGTFVTGTIAVAVGTFDEAGVEIAFEGIYIWDMESEAPDLPPSQRREIDEPESEGTQPGDPQTEADEAEEPEPAAEYDAEARLESILATPSIFHDDFRRNTGAWDIPDEEEYSFTYRQRALLGSITASNWVTWAALQRDLNDFYLEVDVSPISESDTANYGLVFRLEDARNLYQISVRTNGTYSIWKSQDAEWTPLLEWTASTLLVPGAGETNRLGLLVEGPNIALFINGELEATVTDSDITGTRVGLAVETFDETGIEVLFDNVEVWNIAGQ